MQKRTAPLALALVLLAGCGGGGSSPSGSGGTDATGGRASIVFAWPARDARFIPLAANSVVVTLLQDGVSMGQRLVARPGDGSSTASADFSGLAYGVYDVDIKAYPTNNGSDVAQAAGLARITVGENAPASANVSLATTVASLSILPVSVDKRQSATVGVTAKDKDGNVVLLAVGSASERVAWSLVPSAGDLGTGTLAASAGSTVSLTATHSGTTRIHATVDLGGTAPVSADGTVTINAIADGTATITIS